MKVDKTSTTSLPGLFEEKLKINPAVKKDKEEKREKKDDKKPTKVIGKVDKLDQTIGSTIDNQPITTILDRENSTVILHYGSDAYRDLIQLEKITMFPANFLNRHNIESHYRTKIVDWMMEVVHAFNCETETMFLSVTIMDLFLNVSKNKISKDLLHLICTTSIYMASKMEDIMPISVNSVINKIMHNKYNQ